MEGTRSRPLRIEAACGLEPSCVGEAGGGFDIGWGFVFSYGKALGKLLGPEPSAP